MTETHDYTIRHARNEDLARLVELWQVMMSAHEAMDRRIQLAPGALSAYRAYLGHHLANRDARIVVAEAEGRVVGFALAIISSNLPIFLPAYYGYLSDLVVDPLMRRRGIGRMLVGALVEWLRGREITTIQLQHYDQNPTAAAFWRAMGFAPFYQRMMREL